MTTRQETQPLLARVCAEFLDMPGLRLTATQAARLFGVEAERCEHLLRTLVEAGFLRQTRTGLYALLDPSTTCPVDLAS